MMARRVISGSLNQWAVLLAAALIGAPGAAAVQAPFALSQASWVWNRLNGWPGSAVTVVNDAPFPVMVALWLN